jgi:hypothetical protein
LIQEKIRSNFNPRDTEIPDIYTTEMAISRMKMVLLCTVSKGGKDGEIGQVCLKICWLYQDLADELQESDPGAQEKKILYLKESENAAMNAYEHLSNARMHENFPIAGMNETTLDYLLAYFSYKKGEYQQAMHFLSGVITSRNTTPRLKDKSIELKELVSEKLHAEENKES